jgi:acetyl-CoA carboxylase biotin carboxyl carrier protein
MNLTEIQDLIKFVAKSGVTEVEIEEKDFKITIKTETKKAKKEEQTIYVQQPMAQPIAQSIPTPLPAAVPSPAPTQAADTPKGADTAVNDNLLTIKSPMIGTFYRSPGPDKPVFKEVGDTVKSGETVCIIEAMKLFNEIESDISGKIVKVLVDDATPVEYDTPLFLVEPA